MTGSGQASSPPEMDRASIFERVHTLVQHIPPGKVATYGQISNLMGNLLSPLAVGWALHSCPEGVPWQRVVNASGGCSTDRLPDMPQGLQRAMLESEGVAFGDDRFLELCRDGGFDLLCHHAADVTDYRSPDFDLDAARAQVADRKLLFVIAASGGCFTNPWLRAGFRGRGLAVPGCVREEGQVLQPVVDRTEVREQHDTVAIQNIAARKHACNLAVLDPSAVAQRQTGVIAAGTAGIIQRQIGETMVFGPALCRIKRFPDLHQDHDDLIGNRGLELLLQLLQGREFAQAGWAPGSPEVHEHDLSTRPGQ